MADTHVVLVYKNFAAFKGISHIGLGVSAHLTSKFLNHHGVRAQVVSITQPADLGPAIQAAGATGFPVTHVVVAAPWIPTQTYLALCHQYPWVHFAMNCHSNLGFLQADPSGAALFREALELEQGTQNFHAAGNSTKFVRWVQAAYRRPCIYLPNLYYLDATGGATLSRPSWTETGGTLRIAIFGAMRAQKNIITAIGAAIEISTALKAQTEIWLSTEREDDHAARVLMNAARALTDNVPGITLRPSPWASWPQFRRIVANMHLLLQVSYTESFNLVTADGCAEGVPSVVSSAIDWAPRNWVAEVDDTQDVAQTGLYLLRNPHAAREGLLALSQHNSLGLAAWQEYLTATKP